MPPAPRAVSKFERGASGVFYIYSRAISYMSTWSWTCLDGPNSVQVAQVAQIFGGVSTLSGSVRTESVSAEFSTTASEP